MITFTVLSCMTVIANLCVLGSCSSYGIVEGILGEAVKLSCIMSSRCTSSSIQWRYGSNGTTTMAVGNTVHAFSQIVKNSCELHIFNVTVYDAGSYNCSCVRRDNSYQSLCATRLLLICRVEVVVNGKIYSHNSSRTNRSPEVTINANVKDSLKVKCPDGASTNTNCRNLQEKESSQFTFTMRVSSDHNLCRIECQTRREYRVLCSITFKLNISMTGNCTHPSTAGTTVSSMPAPENKIPSTAIPSENMTHLPPSTTVEFKKKKEADIKSVTEKPASFSVIIVVFILISIVVVITVIASFYILSKRSGSQSTKSINPVNPSTNDNIPIGPTYATVNKSSNGSLKEDDTSFEPGVSGTDELYSEVGSAGKEDSSTHQPNSQRAEISITNDIYSEVNPSDVNLKTMENGQETDSALYCKVNKGETQPSQKECTSSQQISGYKPSVCDVPIYHVLEESKRSDHEL